MHSTRSADTNPINSVQSVAQHARIPAAIEIFITNPISQLFSACTSWQQVNQFLQILAAQFNQMFNTRTSWQQSKQLLQTLSVQYSPLLVSLDLF